MKDIITYEKLGIIYVRANGNGFSTFDHVTSGMKRQSKNVWKIKKGATIPSGLKIVHDRAPTKKGHYMIAPDKEMPLMKYSGLLQEFGSDMTRCFKLTPQEITNG